MVFFMVTLLIVFLIQNYPHGKMIATGMYYELQDLDLKNNFKTILAKLSPRF